MYYIEDLKLFRWLSFKKVNVSSVREFVVKYFDKAYELLSLRELRDAPVPAKVE
ncbi:MAG: hypothetical protein QMD13_06710 [Candidatus Bathyarchaeia archaeon]|nr:hypothetical protein [Candidatus Bathyarchaeia archaeon]MDI6905160.1 hypothetical protein [Candidatus Bathyarchaeia archaeon]